MINQIREICKDSRVELLINLSGAIPILLHELGHWVPAYIFHLHPVLHWRAVDFDPTTRTRDLVVTLVPTALGLALIGAGLILITRWARTTWDIEVALLVASLGVIQLLASGHDWRDAWQLVRYEKEPDGH